MRKIILCSFRRYNQRRYCTSRKTDNTTNLITYMISTFFHKRFKRAIWFTFCLILQLQNTSLSSFAKERLIISAIPDQNPEHLNRLHTVLARELSKELNVEVKYIPVINYPAAVSAFRTESIDLVWFGGLTGVQARIQKPGARVVAQRDIDAKFHSVFIANQKSNLPLIKDLSDLSLLKGRRFTFGSESSTSGRLMPQHFLQKAGVRITDFKGGRPGFSGSHDATLALVQSGSYEVGALNEEVWKQNIATNKIDTSKVKVIWRTPPYFDYHWLTQPNIDERFGKGFTNKIRDTLTSFTKESKSQKIILELFGAEKFIPAYSYQYRDIETIGRQLGKIK
ncbi:Putative phosphonate binding protein for ABC transporter [Prochlorococcus marinus str. MIT 9211]|uniref:Putative phosphonate binding protein for ABC transporter n=2 Tax=Prochlorococcus marinus TaxID=1219 RepID=A9BA55_PROM4|nr:Putative phosphonate binding protein for ABC transporter [Prochlorococcus marinus str. MIT 9211]